MRVINLILTAVVILNGADDVHADKALSQRKSRKVRNELKIERGVTYAG